MAVRWLGGAHCRRAPLVREGDSLEIGGRGAVLCGELRLVLGVPGPDVERGRGRLVLAPARPCRRVVAEPYVQRDVLVGGCGAGPAHAAPPGALVSCPCPGEGAAGMVGGRSHILQGYVLPVGHRLAVAPHVEVAAVGVREGKSRSCEGYENECECKRCQECPHEYYLSCLIK